MIITWYGTASISIETDHDRIVFDPFVPLSDSGISVKETDFERFPLIFITHGHFDHIASIPKLAIGKNVGIVCTRTPANTLAKNGVTYDIVRVVKPGDAISLNDIELRVYQGRHIKFDSALVRSTLCNARMLKHIGNLPRLLRQNAVCKENGEIVAYHIQAEGKSILLLGSLGFDPTVTYPKDVDLLILPFQGATDLVSPSMKIIQMVNPKRVLVDHFDDSFPPISNTIPLDGLRAALSARCPDVELLIPNYREPICL